MRTAPAAVGGFLAAAVAAAAVGTAGADVAVREVAMPGKVYVPQELDVLVGDTVVWQNGDTINHTVTARDDSFDSGFLQPGGTFTQAFSKPATVEYYCTIHRFMRGVLRVVPVALSGPGEAVGAGSAIALRGLTSSGTRRVVLERAAGGSWAPFRSVVVAADGTFNTRVVVRAPERFRARAERASSRVLRVAVAPRVVARVVAGRVEAGIRPARPGAIAALQRYDRERFDWRTVDRATVRRGSRIGFSLAPDRRRVEHYRIVVRAGDGWADGASPAVAVHP